MASMTTYLPSHRALSSFDWYQFILLSDTCTCVNNLPNVLPEVEPWPFALRVQRPNHYTTRPDNSQIANSQTSQLI